MKLKTTLWDPTEFLDSPKSIAKVMNNEDVGPAIEAIRAAIKAAGSGNASTISFKSTQRSSARFFARAAETAPGIARPASACFPS